MKDKNWRRRIYIFGLISTIFWLAIIVRLFVVQVIQGSEYQAKARMQYQRIIESDAPRGEILDRHFNKFAVDLAYCAFGAHVNQIDEPDKIAATFAKYTGTAEQEFKRKLLSKNSTFVWMDRKVELAVGEKIWEENLKGISRLINYRRYYPYSTVASQVIGFTDVDNKGLSGIELQFDEILAGKPGKMILKADAWGRHIPDPDYIVDEPKKGHSIVLTIDLIYQSILEEELRNGVQRSNAKGGLGILMNPRTGEILAMTGMPNFNANEAQKFHPSERKNRTITDSFEPGSTFKIVTAAAALEERIKRPTDKMFCENGKFRIYNHLLNDVHPYGILTFRQIIEKSSNIGTMKIAQELGAKRLYKYARDFGFGNETGIRSMGEVEGLLKSTREWSGLSLYEIAIGQEVAVTALQLINAYAAIANDGVLLCPHLLYAEIDEEGRIISQTTPQAIRRVVSKSTADTLESFFEGVILSGTGTAAAIPGIRMAGKTGTAQRAMENARGYGESQYTSSFVGFGPVEDPKIIGLIVLECPRGAYYGGAVAAPVFKNVMQRIFALLDQKAQMVDMTENSDEVSSWALRRLPDVRGCWMDVARQRLEDLNFKANFVGNGGFVSGQIPPPGSDIAEGQNVILTLSPKEPTFQSEASIPDVRGCSVRKAMNLLAQNRIRVEVRGHGQVISQSLPAGSIAPIGALCVLECRTHENYVN